MSDSHKVYYGIFLFVDISRACINLALNRIRIGLSGVDAIPVGYCARLRHRARRSRPKARGLEMEMADEWEAKPVQRRFGKNARQLCAADAAELPGAYRRRLSRSCQHRLRSPGLHLVADFCAL